MSEVCFKVTGEWITNILRSKFWNEGMAYKDVLELGNELLINPEISKHENEQNIKGILEGRYKLEGITPDIHLIEDGRRVKSLEIDDLLKEIKNLKKSNKVLSKKLKNSNAIVKQLRKSLDEWNGYSDLTKKVAEKVADIAKKQDCIYKLRVELGKGSILDTHTFYDKIFPNSTSEDKEKFGKFCDEFGIYPGISEHGYWRWINFYDKKTDEVLGKEDFINRGIAIVEKPTPKENTEVHSSDIKKEEPEKEPLGYGWVSPSGEFIPSPWGTHEESAWEICKKKSWDKLQDKSRHLLCRDYLVFEKGYVLIDNPLGIGSPRTTYDVTRITKKQKDFLFGYYTDIGDQFKARQFMED